MDKVFKDFYLEKLSSLSNVPFSTVQLILNFEIHLYFVMYFQTILNFYTTLKLFIT